LKKNIRQPGDKTEVICEECQAVRKATWNYDNYLLDDGTVVKEVMLAHCDVCGAQAGLAQQSSYLIRNAREKNKRRDRTTITLSRPLRDLAETRVFKAGSSSMSAVEVILLSVLAVLREPDRREKYLLKIKTLEDKKLLKSGTYSERLPIRFNRTTAKLMEEVTAATKLSRSEFVRRAILLEDNLVNEHVRTFTLV